MPQKYLTIDSGVTKLAMVNIFFSGNENHQNTHKSLFIFYIWSSQVEK